MPRLIAGRDLTLKGKESLYGRELKASPLPGLRERNSLPERGIEELGLVWRRRSISAFGMGCPHQHGKSLRCYFLREMLPWAGPM